MPERPPSDEIDPWSYNPPQRKAILLLAHMPEPLFRMVGVGPETIDQLMAWGLVAVAGMLSRHAIYRLTDKGWKAHEALTRAGRLPRR